MAIWDGCGPLLLTQVMIGFARDLLIEQSRLEIYILFFLKATQLLPRRKVEIRKSGTKVNDLCNSYLLCIWVYKQDFFEDVVAVEALYIVFLSWRSCSWINLDIGH